MSACRFCLLSGTALGLEAVSSVAEARERLAEQLQVPLERLDLVALADISTHKQYKKLICISIYILVNYISNISSIYILYTIYYIYTIYISVTL